MSGNPETKTDPSGHCPWCIAGAIIGAVVGAGIVSGVQVYNNYQSGASNPWTNNTDWGAVGMGALAGAFVGATMRACKGRAWVVRICSINSRRKLRPRCNSCSIRRVGTITPPPFWPGIIPVWRLRSSA